jgi:hypothetical protein
MTRINLNKLAREVTLKESGKRNLNIGDIKEVQKLTFEELINNYSEADILKMPERYLG